jgi:hypothetical protein
MTEKPLRPAEEPITWWGAAKPQYRFWVPNVVFGYLGVTAVSVVTVVMMFREGPWSALGPLLVVGPFAAWWLSKPYRIDVEPDGLVLFRKAFGSTSIQASEIVVLKYRWFNLRMLDAREQTILSLYRTNMNVDGLAKRLRKLNPSMTLDGSFGDQPF